MAKEIAKGNYVKTSYFTTNGAMDVLIGVSETGNDDTRIVFEDGLYKVFKNGELVRAATQCLITIKDKLQ